MKMNVFIGNNFVHIFVFFFLLLFLSHFAMSFSRLHIIYLQIGCYVQMPDDQVTNKIAEHGRSSTTPKVSQAKIGKNREKNATASTATGKKLKNQRCKVNGVNEIPSTKSSITNTSSSNKERNAGSVVITIRLLKMESAKNVESITISDGDEFQRDTYSNNNYSTQNVSQNQCENNQTSTSSEFPRHYVNVQDVNRNQNQNASYKLDNNNGALNQCDIHVPTCSKNVRNIDGGITVNNFMICDIGNNGEMEQNNTSTKINCTLHSEASICDKNLVNYTSQSKQQPTNMVNPFNKINSTDTTQTESNSMQSHNTNTTKTTLENAQSFVSSNLINTVSPYPHHIPIANIIRSDCLNTVIDERKYTIYTCCFFYLLPNCHRTCD